MHFMPPFELHRDHGAREISSAAPDRKGVEELWRKRLSDARLRLESALKHVKEVQKDLVGAPLLSPDGWAPYERALRAENLAFEEYQRVRSVANGNSAIEIGPNRPLSRSKPSLPCAIAS
jgi:hypothetical protein